MKKRTNFDFSKHELKIEESDLATIHYLFLPERGDYQKIVFANINTGTSSLSSSGRGILAVTGDYGNYIFNRRFFPSAEGEGISDGYWEEKLSVKPVYDSKQTKKNIENFREEHKEELSDEDIDFLDELYGETDNQLDAEYCAYRRNENSDFLDPEILMGYSYGECLPIVFDAFEEICRRLKEFK